MHDKTAPRNYAQTPTFEHIGVLWESHFTGPGGHRIACIAHEPPAHRVHHHFQSGGLKDGHQNKHPVSTAL